MFSKQFGLILAILAAVMMVPAGWAMALGLDDTSSTASTPAAKDASLDQALQFFESEATVSVVSHSTELASEAPGIVSVWTAKDMSRLGDYTLADLALITPGFGIQNAYNNASFEVRGFSAGGFNNNLVYEMVDGITINNARNNRAFVGDELPLFFADRVEMLKGPASSLYGSGAFLGVVNIVSKDTEDGKDLFEMRASGGDPGNEEQLLANAIINKGDAKFKIFFGTTTEDNLGLMYADGSAPGHFSEQQDWEKTYFADISTEFTNKDSWTNGLKLGAIVIQKDGGWGQIWFGANSPVDNVDFQDLLPFVQYNKDLSDTVHLYVKGQEQSDTEAGQWADASPDQSVTPGTVLATNSAFNAYDVQTRDWDGKAELTWKANDTTNVVGGIEYDNRYQLAGPLGFNYYQNVFSTGVTNQLVPNGWIGPLDEKSAYLQAKEALPVLAGLDITAGLRYDESNSTAGIFSPRVGLVQKLTDNLDIKALYETALYDPDLKSAFFNPANLDLPAILPEQIQSWEVSAVFHQKEASLSATYFYDQIYNQAAQEAYDKYNTGSTNGQEIAYNVNGYMTSQGVEAAGEYKVADGKAFANFTLQDINDQVGIQAAGIPQYTASAGILYDIKSTKSSFGLVGKYMGQINNADALKTTVASAYTLFDLDLRQEVAEGLIAEVKCANIFNTSYTLPGNYQMPGQTWLASVGTKF